MAAFRLTPNKTRCMLRTDRVWTMDGDRYAVVLPRHKHLQRYNQMLTQFLHDDIRNQFGPINNAMLMPSIMLGDPGQYDEGLSLVMSPGTMGNQDWEDIQFRLGYWEDGFFYAQQPRDYLLGWNDKSGARASLHWSGPETKLPWRPLLVPLDQEDKMDVSLISENPNGTLVSGGTLYLDSLRGESEPTVGDTWLGKELKWVWIDGCMLCLEVLCNVSPEYLAANGLVCSASLPA